MTFEGALNRQMKNIFRKLHANKCLIMPFYKFTDNNCRLRLFSEFIQ